jgi:bifunctional DNA-binding transcriptional regulator/antitoxin component of YhaV-PrlF toxin-antitoxin module
LSVTIPKRIVQATTWKAGDILEFVAMTEGTEWQEQYVKVRKVSD